jgi:hypothetical protein
MCCEPLRHLESAKRNERDDEYQESNCGDRLRAGDHACDAKDLNADEKSDLLTGNGVEGIVALDEALF